MSNHRPSGLLGTALLFCAALSAQQPQPDGVIRVTADHVLVDVRVVNRGADSAIEGLRADDYEIYEDNVEQHITHFSQDAMPISVILLLDVSGSMQSVIQELHRNAFAALHQLKSADEVALIAYGGLAHLLQNFTTNRQLLVDKIGWVNALYAGPRSTQLAEAVFQAAVHMRHAANPVARRYIVAVTDNLSTWIKPTHTTKQALDQLLESTTSLCGLTMINTRRADNAQLAGILGNNRMVSLQDFATPTGGEVLPSAPATVTTQLAALFDRIRTCYSLGYTPSNLTMRGEFRKIRVRLKPTVLDKLLNGGNRPAIISRSGYYAVTKPSIAFRERNSTIDSNAGISLVPEDMYSRPSPDERQIARALFVSKTRREFKTTLIKSVVVDPDGQAVTRISIRVHPDGIHFIKIDDRYHAVFRLLAAVFSPTGMVTVQPPR